MTINYYTYPSCWTYPSNQHQSKPHPIFGYSSIDACNPGGIAMESAVKVINAYNARADYQSVWHPDSNSSNRSISEWTDKYNVTRLDLSRRLELPLEESDNLTIIQNEIDMLSEEDQRTFRSIWYYLLYSKMNRYRKPNRDIYKILNYLHGKTTLENVGLTRENGAYFLRLIKLFDLAELWSTRISRFKVFFKNSTYELRTHILELLSPEMETTEAYTYSILPRPLEYYKNYKNWLPERIRFIVSYVILPEFIKMRSCSEKLNYYPPRIYAVRGNTASFKTTILEQKFGVKKGTLNPDNQKLILKIMTSRKRCLTNTQVHKEATQGPLSLYKEGVLQSRKYSLIIDTRLSMNEEFDELVMAAKRREGSISLIDIDTPLYCSMERVLVSRNLFGAAPCVPSSAIRDGFIQIRNCRKGIIQTATQELSVNHYELLSVDQEGQITPVAEKNGSPLEIISPHLFKRCLKPPTLEELAIDMNQPFPKEPWAGVPIRIALDCHAAGLTKMETIERMEKEHQFGTAQIMPFSGSWLFDYPHIKEHLDTEHLLHVRGFDKNGVGIHWSTTQFSWKFNPQYNPEAAGGFQMKLGYFIVPLHYAEIFTSHSLSDKVINNLKIFSSNGVLIGYRFFVHPEAYLHFHALYETGISFVKSEDSEFMGTPTSSYRSWAVRQVFEHDGSYYPCEGSIPFIVKLGVSGANDRNRLLPRSEVENSVKVQNYLDQRESTPNLLIFRETLGIALKNIPNYPPKAICELTPVDSGMIIREFPPQLMEGQCKIISFSAVMSAERLKYPHSFVIDSEKEGQLPLIYELIDNAIKKGVVKNSFEFIQCFLIDQVLNALEKLMFEDALSLALHAQNLCLVLDIDNIPIGVAIRDHGDIQNVWLFLETHFQFYRNSVFKPLINVITKVKTYEFPKTFTGTSIPPQRSVYYYLSTHKTIIESTAKEVLKKLSITFDQYHILLNYLDSGYHSLLSKYFNLSGIPELQALRFPQIETLSPGKVMSLNRILHQRKRKITHSKPILKSIPNLVTYNENPPKSCKPTHRWTFSGGMSYLVPIPSQ
jgi:hypothetical protein